MSTGHTAAIMQNYGPAGLLLPIFLEMFLQGPCNRYSVNIPTMPGHPV